MRRNVEGAIDLTIPQDAHAVLRKLPNEAGVNEFLRTDLRSGIEFREIADVDDRKFLLERGVRETSLRQAPMQRHLAAFETPLLTAARTGPHALVSAASGFLMSGAWAASQPLRLMR